MEPKVQLSGDYCDLKLRQSRHTTLFHNINKTLFIIVYFNYYLLKISDLKIK